MRFMARHALDRWAPSNLPMTNPEVLERTIAENGGTWCAGSRSSPRTWSGGRRASRR
jgi:poly(3-hydroxyalkanoate) synthetase